MKIAVCILIPLLIVYNYLVFEMIDRFLNMPRLKKVYRLPVGIMNAGIVMAFTLLLDSTSFGFYILTFLLLYSEFVIFYRDKRSGSLFCALACLIHVMAIRSLCVSFFALALSTSIYAIINTPLYLVVSTCVTIALLSTANYLVLTLIPAQNVRILNQHNDQRWFMISCLFVFCLYLLINSLIYSTPVSHLSLITNQIVAPLTLLSVTYIILFYSFKTSNLLGYKEKTEALQHTVDKERQYRNTMDRDVFRTIEVNFSKNEILSGFEDYEDQIGNAIHNYEKMISYMIQTSVHPDDRGEFIKYLSPSTLIDSFESGITNITFDYRRLLENKYVWMRVLMVLMSDSDTNDLKSFVQIKNIDTEKRQQLDLQYKAERDLLTGLYNKITTEILISKQLASAKDNGLPAVLFVIDIDNFKTINDRLGHLYGDAVLSELSESLQRVFRDTDVVGRIGGDEFLVFAQGIQSEKMIIKKANEVCKMFFRTYSDEKSEGYTVSSSIGIALYPKDGTSFTQLFKHADVALYTTKSQGKNGYSFYDKNVEIPYVSTRTEIDTHGMVPKNFKSNRIEYVFRLLYGSEDTKKAIESTLELIAKTYGFSRANIFEFNELSTHFNGVFEWCATDICSVSDNYIDIPVSKFEFIIAALNKSGGMFMATPATDFSPAAQESYATIGIKSIVHFSIKERDILVGVIAFQNCIEEDFKLSDTDFEELRTICQVLSVFMAKRLSNEREKRHHHAIEAVMDNTNSISYVIDRETYDVFYENQHTIEFTGRSGAGAKCYNTYRGFDVPCEDCPLKYLSEEHPRCTLELYTSKFDIYTKTSAAFVNWSNNRPAMLISSVDITEYKSKKNKG